MVARAFGINGSGSGIEPMAPMAVLSMVAVVDGSSCLKALLQYSVLWDLNSGLHLVQTLFIFNLSKAYNY
jgi:hypothetical protein